MVKC
jgi:hypothetical protein